MPADVLTAAPTFQWADDNGNTVTVVAGRVHVHLTNTVLPVEDALDVSAALACAVQHIAEHRITNPTNQTSPTEGA